MAHLTVDPNPTTPGDSYEGMAVAPDWRGQPSVELDVAARWFQRREVETAEHEAAWGRFEADGRDWQAGRSAAARVAYAAAQQATRGRGLGDTVAMGQGQHDAAEAAADYERSVPRPRWSNGKAAVALEYVNENEAPKPGGVVAKAAAKLRNKTTEVR